ncbi:hypothetical protein BOTNAR_0077g00250 [Botryotinia narcissicola]|uniref:Uncharacterized protein n=1 Tax=Botryotinia narcissicola TaxID=278944 RepID=A0A4Z1IW20_9HELO|nr:hypothetical protein BOTNAR_0077g00250 [Botryotinia narcissicola]
MASLLHQIKIRQRDKRIYSSILKQGIKRRKREAALRVALEEPFHDSRPRGWQSLPEYQYLMSIPSSCLPLLVDFRPVLCEEESSKFTLFRTLPAETQLMIWEFASSKPSCMSHRHRTHQKELICLRNPQMQGRILYGEPPIGSGGVNYYDASLALLRILCLLLNLGHDSVLWLLDFDLDARFLSQNEGLEDSKTLDAQDSKGL